MSRQPQIDPPFCFETTRLDKELNGYEENPLIYSHETIQKATSHKAETKRQPKPPYTYAALIATAIMNSPEKKLTCAEIQSSIELMFPFFNGDYKGWKSSVRQILSQHDCFIKEPTNAKGRSGKPHLWSVDLAKLPPNFFKRRSSSLENVLQYALYLHDELGLPEIKHAPRVELSETTTTARHDTGQGSIQDSTNGTYNPHSIVKILNKSHSDNSKNSPSRIETTATPNYYENYNVSNVCQYDSSYSNTNLVPQQSVPDLYADFQYASCHHPPGFSTDLSHRLNNLTPFQSSLYSSSGQISDYGIDASHSSLTQEFMYMDMEFHNGYSAGPVFPTLPNSPVPVQWGDPILTMSAIDFSRKRKLSG